MLGGVARLKMLILETLRDYYRSAGTEGSRELGGYMVELVEGMCESEGHGQ